MNPTDIASVATATVRAALPAPVVFGDWIMNHREFVVVRITLGDGTHGWAFTLTRDGAVAEQIDRSLKHDYVGSDAQEPIATFDRIQASSFGSYSSGVGLRALSILDLATWDALSRHRGETISATLGGQLSPMPATAIIGYPPATMGPRDVAEQVTQLWADGWRRFKIPVARDLDSTVARIAAAREAAPEAWLGCDAAWIFRDWRDAVALADACRRHSLGWLEDIFPPGDIDNLVELRRVAGLPVAMGDEQGGAYYPQALIAAGATDVVRIDLTCMGGISGGRRIVERCLQTGTPFAPHMFAHVHSQVFSAWGYPDVPIEWGVPWTGVDPFADSLEQPSLLGDGRMAPLRGGAGFGRLVDLPWLATQDVSDPQGILHSAQEGGQ